MTPEAFNKAMGTVLRKHRLSCGLRQLDVGASFDVSYQQVNKIEHGYNAASAYQLTKLAKLFGVSVADLYREAGAGKQDAQLTEAQSDGFLAAKYVGRIADPKLRSNLVDFARKLAYPGAAA
jgi:transcriptional regulator with XRE-family HTH domain